MAYTSFMAKDLITPRGFAKLKGELDFLWREERPRVTAEVSAAAALGDRSENAEYIYGKKRLREIDRRLRYLKKRLEGVRVVRSIEGDDGHVGVPARKLEADAQRRLPLSVARPSRSNG